MTPDAVWKDEERFAVGNSTFKILPGEGWPSLERAGWAETCLKRGKPMSSSQAATLGGDYARLIEGLRPEYVFELGFYRGGSTALIAGCSPPAPSGDRPAPRWPGPGRRHTPQAEDSMVWFGPTVMWTRRIQHARRDRRAGVRGQRPRPCGRLLAPVLGNPRVIQRAVSAPAPGRPVPDRGLAVGTCSPRCRAARRPPP